MKGDNSEFSRIAWDQFMCRLRVPRAERVARRLTEGKERAARRAGKTGEMGRPILQ